MWLGTEPVQGVRELLRRAGVGEIACVDEDVAQGQRGQRGVHIVSVRDADDTNTGTGIRTINCARR